MGGDTRSEDGLLSFMLLPSRGAWSFKHDLCSAVVKR